ncbi:hypothetical protein [Luteolibacter sp. Populi]|uniref:hypothetical protein n=1 Tax=Luteolibacter sp. Populi TaxID=3230487 RepID=UPI003466459D
MKPAATTDEIPWRLHENLKGIVVKMLADGEAPGSERMRQAMRESLQTWQESEGKAHAVWIDQRLASLREAENEVDRELREIQERAGFFGRGGGVPDLERAQAIVDGYGRKRFRIWSNVLLKVFGTLLCSLVIAFITVDAMQDYVGDHSLLGWLEDKKWFGLTIARPWLFVVVLFLLGKLFFRLCFQVFRRLEPPQRVKKVYVFGLVATLAVWFLISLAFEMRKDGGDPPAPATMVPAEKSERVKKM